MIELNKLNYNYDALEPYIDATTMTIHHDKHHQGYVDNYNKVINKYPELQDKTVEEVLTNINTLTIDPADKQAIINQGGGVANHNLFWQIMDPTNQTDTVLLEEIKKTFDTLEDFKQKFTEVATKHFGSGWIWLIRNQNNVLEIYALPNQDSPLSLGHQPLLTLDVWEHAYYLKYQNKRVDYIKISVGYFE
ncbi:MAG: Superoxide dismutase [Candidatus Falkowbacteria bacterium GW2011_GWA2_39_24]|uniref:Superoxide dismutase n=1 Tax=Candidatus Falkowbacteria bacterium GW2011_GWA2_39_24 TaxID=1618634 RepID=A0A0G0QRZ4_9BACT|nr:MAG: Superoxide dismutase [Candidatus Falkowbacteria bacterium GW2011_GWA2_39_24]